MFSPRILVIALLLLSVLHAQSPSGSVCVAPVPKVWKPQALPPGIRCESSNITVSFDGEASVKWPQSRSLLIDSLDISRRHRVVVSCNGRPQQSFQFRFDAPPVRMCLFLNDLYNTVNLWPAPAPSCTCP